MMDIADKLEIAAGQKSLFFFERDCAQSKATFRRGSLGEGGCNNPLSLSALLSPPSGTTLDHVGFIGIVPSRARNSRGG